MIVNISKYNEYVVLAGNDKLNRYIVKGDKIAELFATHERVCTIAEIACFECYVCNPETGETGYDIVWIEGVKENIKKYYPHFDCFITRDYPSHCEPIKFYKLSRVDYDLA